MTASGADAIEVFLQTEEFDTKALLEALRTRLPLYMVPRSIRLFDEVVDLPVFQAHSRFEKSKEQPVVRFWSFKIGFY